MYTYFHPRLDHPSGRDRSKEIIKAGFFGQSPTCYVVGRVGFGLRRVKFKFSYIIFGLGWVFFGFQVKSFSPSLAYTFIGSGRVRLDFFQVG